MLERLQKLIAQAGIASRRGAEEIIAAGEVTVNGTVAALGAKADPEKDHIKVRGKLINFKIERRSNAYILVNKPKGYLSSASDPENRKLVVDLVKGFGRLFPVGRLDYNTEGLIILTNDGEFANFIASSKKIAKVYEVKVKGLPPAAAINKLRRGVLLEDGFKTSPAQIVDLKPTDKNGWYEVTLLEGHNQQIRKMFDAIGHSVVKLRRIRIGSIPDTGLKAGDSRELDASEVAALREAKVGRKRPPANPNKLPLPSRSRKKTTRESAPGARPSGKGPARP